MTSSSAASDVYERQNKDSDCGKGGKGNNNFDNTKQTMDATTIPEQVYKSFSLEFLKKMKSD